MASSPTVPAVKQERQKNLPQETSSELKPQPSLETSSEMI